MAKIFGIQNDNAKLTVLRSIREPGIRVDQGLTKDLSNSLVRFNLFWELMDTVRQHGYLRAAMSVVGRSAVGAWWNLRRHTEYGKTAPDRHRRRLFDFYMYQNRQWDNIKDYQSFAGKLMIGTMYLRFFGQAAYSVIRDANGQPLGLDFLHGFILPNVDSAGRFKNPAFIQYPNRNTANRVEFSNPRDIVYLTNPDWEGAVTGGTDIESLSSFVLPLDLYLMTAAREYMKNRDTPELVYSLPSDISDDAFEAFVAQMEARHSGPNNVGRNQIAVQGEFDVKELRPLPTSLPYQQSRQEARDEELAVAGVSGAKMGLSQQMTSANLREMRREYHETGLVPLLMLIELGFYEQVHVREFGFSGWQFKFNSPDFLNAVERATVHMRYHQMGALTPNEIRYDIGKPARDDEGGDAFLDSATASDNQPGSPPEGRPVEPDAPSQTGEPSLDDQDPPRGDQHDDTPRDSILREFRIWRKFAMRRIERGKSQREFRSSVIPQDVIDVIMPLISEAGSAGEVAQIFDGILADVEELL